LHNVYGVLVTLRAPALVAEHGQFAGEQWRFTTPVLPQALQIFTFGNRIVSAIRAHLDDTAFSLANCRVPAAEPVHLGKVVWTRDAQRTGTMMLPGIIPKHKQGAMDVT
jgi:hypothetical protein